MIQGSRGLISKLVAKLTTLFRHIDPLILTPHIFCNAIAISTGSRELVFFRYLKL